jgi:hypothetical protein
MSTPGKRRARSASFAANRPVRLVHGFEFGCLRTRTVSRDAKFPLKQVPGGMLGMHSPEAKPPPLPTVDDIVYNGLK